MHTVVSEGEELGLVTMMIHDTGQAGGRARRLGVQAERHMGDKMKESGGMRTRKGGSSWLSELS